METFLLIAFQVLLLSATCYAMHAIGFMSGISFQENIWKHVEREKNEQIRQLEKYVERLEKERGRLSDGY